jgi:lipoprotein-releasing system permease protein
MSFKYLCKVNEFRNLNTELFIARRIVSGGKGNFSRPIVVVAIAAIALGLTIMFVAIAILTGFQKEIREKVVGFGGHIQVTKFSENSTFEPQPFERNQPFVSRIAATKGIKHIQGYGVKAGIIKSKDQILGVVLKGVDKGYDWVFFRDKLQEGRLAQLRDTGKSDDVIVSRYMANKLNLKLNDDLRMYFISGNSTLGRKFRICGIYETGLEEFDKMYVIGDLRHVQKLNNWTSSQVGGFEITISNFSELDKLGMFVYHQIGFSLDASTIRQLYPQIFDWLDLQDINVLIILVLMVMVSAITMISTLLILILERTNMIGILKSLGMRNISIRKIFLYNAAYIIGLGILWGNAASFTICLLQQKFGLIKLSQESYYVSVVPINLDAINILLLNAGTLLVCYLMLLMPSLVITRITPLKAIRFS